MKAGFTLLEMLVVMVLAVSLVGVVGPRIYASVDNIRADAEERALRELVEYAGLRAFFSRADQTLVFRDSQALLPPDRVVTGFSFITFPEQSVTWDANGFTAAESLAYAIQGRESVLDLRKMTITRP